VEVEKKRIEAVGSSCRWTDDGPVGLCVVYLVLFIYKGHCYLGVKKKKREEGRK
jgi:hypothetical protein